MNGKSRNLLIVALSASIVIGVTASLLSQRNDPVVRLTEVECQAAQKAYDDGKREQVLSDIVRDCDRSGFPIRR